MNLKYIKTLIPYKIYYIAAWSIFSAFLTSAAVYGVAMMLQVFTVFLGFSKSENIAVFLQPLSSDASLFFIVFTFLVLLQGVGQFLQTFINMAFAETFNYEIRKKFLDLQFSHSFNPNYDLGEASHIVAEVIPKGASYVTSIVRFVTLLVQVVILGFLSILSMPKEFLISIIILSALTPIVLFLNRKSKIFGATILECSRKFNSQLMRSIKNFLYLKIIGMEQKEKKEVIKSAKNYYNQFMKSSLYYSVANALPATFSTLVVVYLFYFFSIQGLSAPALLTMFYVLYRFASTLSQMLAITNGINMYRPNFDNILILLKDASREGQSKSIASELRRDFSNKISLTAEKLSFGYSSNSCIFSDIKVDMQKGDMLVIKGASGSGKTTLLMVLTGIFPQSSGVVSWGGLGLDVIDKELFRENIGYIGPEPFIITGTVRDNLCYGLRENPSEEQLWSACRISEASGFIESLAAGMNTALSEFGNGLSMGQKQRLGMARALLRKPKILLLDEVTANLDKKTERALIQNISRIKSDMIILVSTHSDSFDVIADQILCMDKSLNIEK
jgi:ABC-type bacteriocin/lantibiotic exporter with double-glycine peptidase domain